MGTPIGDASAKSLPIDQEDLLARCLGRKDIAQRVLQTFHRTLFQDLEQLEQALKASDLDEVARIAHRLKGASLSVAAHDVRQCAQTIEGAAQSRSLPDIETHFVKLQEECQRFDNLDGLI